MALQVGKDQVGLAKQAARGTIAANPTFVHGLTGGGLTVGLSQEADPVTSAYLSPAGAFRDKAENGADLQTRAWQKAIGLYLLAALGNDAVTGTGPYTHTITLGSALNYFTVFEKKGDNSIWAVKDCKLDELGVEWDENKPLDVAAKWVGGALSFPAIFTGTVDESDTTSYFTPVGGSFKLDLDSATPAVVPVKAGSVTVKRAVDARYFSGSIEAADTWEGSCEVEVGLTVVPDDTTWWRTLLTGAAGGSAIQATPVYGSFEVTFVKGADSLKLSGANVAFLADLPEADPDGGAAEMELSGIGYRAGGTPLTAVLINTQAAY